MRVDTFGDEALAQQAGDHNTSRHSLDLTAAELRRLGLSRVGYVTVAASAGGDIDIVIHGADGMTVANANSVEVAVDLAYQLGLTLVPVH
jgi:hypothetical protein